MSNHIKTRVNDQYHCSCGLQWDVDEADPHRPTTVKRAINRAIGNRALKVIKENLNRE